MKHFKKRTLALVLASVVTVVGSFAAENYKNRLMQIDLKAAANGAVKMQLQTRAAYSGNIAPIKKDAKTYVITLPEIDSSAPTPNISDTLGNLESVEIRTMPYSGTAKGYTRITIKTSTPDIKLYTYRKVFIPSQNRDSGRISQNNYQSRTMSPEQQHRLMMNTMRKSSYQQEEQIDYDEQEEIIEEEVVEEEVAEPVPQTNVESGSESVENVIAALPETNDYSGSGDSSEAFLLVLGIFLVLISVSFLYVKAKNKMHELSVENLDLDTTDYGDMSEGPQMRKISGAVVSLDSLYKKSSSYPKKKDYSKPIPVQMPQNNPIPVEKVNVVDLDEIFQEQKSKEDEENEALEDFLSGFSFDEPDELISNEQEKQGYDEEYYSKVINSEMNFSDKDVERMSQLLNTEIQDNTLRNATDFLVSSPVLPTKRDSQKVLEDLVSTYTISNNITFTSEDIDILNKLISVEIDNDFVTDLRTNPERTKEVQAEIEKLFEKPKKTSEVIILNVKDMLPDLSEELRKQGNEKIKSDYKPDTVYAEEGYEVATLSISNLMPDLVFEKDTSTTYQPRPKVEPVLSASGYSAPELKISDKLPDLADAIKHLEKHQDKKDEPVEVNEKDMLDKIQKVQFKPFYQEESESELADAVNKAPSVSDIKEEFKQFSNFEIAHEEESISPVKEDVVENLQVSFEEDYVDLDKEKAKEEFVNKTDFVSAKPERNTPQIPKARGNSNAENLIKRIQERRNQIKSSDNNKKESKISENKLRVEKNNFESTKCIVEDKIFTVVSTAEFSDKSGCHLAKNDDGYTVLGYIGDKLTTIKTYDELKSEKIQARLSEKIDDNLSKYIIRIGTRKFIVEVSSDKITYVMDLC